MRSLKFVAAVSVVFALAAPAATAFADDGYFVIATIVGKPGKADALRSLLVPAVASFRKESGCLSYALLEDTRRPGRFMTYEKWTNKNALAAHMTAPTLTALGPKLKDMLASPLKQDFLNALVE